MMRPVDILYMEELRQKLEKNCPICKKTIDEDSFRDTLSLREFEISGMCQECQDGVFGK